MSSHQHLSQDPETKYYGKWWQISPYPNEKVKKNGIPVSTLIVEDTGRFAGNTLIEKQVESGPIKGGTIISGKRNRTSSIVSIVNILEILTMGSGKQSEWLHSLRSTMLNRVHTGSDVAKDWSNFHVFYNKRF